MSEHRDAYKILGVSPIADTHTIERAYRKLARKYHPDLNPSSDATAKMQDINWARDTLTDPRRRLFHDLERRRRASRTGSYTPYTTTRQHTTHTPPQQRRTTTTGSQQQGSQTGSQQRTSYTGSWQRTTYAPPHDRARSRRASGQQRSYTSTQRTARSRTRTVPQSQSNVSWRGLGCMLWIVFMVLRACLEFDTDPSRPTFKPPTYNPNNNFFVTMEAFMTDSAESPGLTFATALAPQTPRPTSISVLLEWNLIDRDDERVYYQLVLDEAGKQVDVGKGGYIGRYDPPDAARYYCPPDPMRSGPPSSTDECIQFFSTMPDPAWAVFEE